MSVMTAAPVEDTAAESSSELSPYILATVLNMNEADAQEAFDKALADDMEVVDKLWRAAYTKAITGNKDAQDLARSMLAWRTEVAARLEIAIPHNLPIQETPIQAIRRAAGLIANATPNAVMTLDRIMKRGRSEAARVQAAKAMLDRGGLVGGERVEVSWADPNGGEISGVDQHAALTVVLERLSKIKEAKFG